MRRTAVWLMVAASVFAQSTAKSHVRLSVYLAVVCGAPDAGTTHLQPPAGGKCLSRKPFLTEKDVQSAELQENSQGRPTLFLTFHDDAAIRELQITKKNIGNFVAILLNGKLVSTVRIAAASRLLYVDGNFTEEQVKSMAAELNRAARKP